MPTPDRTPDQIINELTIRGDIGLDLSPGDELCAQAAELIRALQNDLAQVRYERSLYKEDALKYRDLCR